MSNEQKALSEMANQLESERAKVAELERRLEEANTIFQHVVMLRFSHRKKYFEMLQSKAQEVANAKVAWPDALLFLDGNDFKETLAKIKGECICGEINARHCPVHQEGEHE